MQGQKLAVGGKKPLSLQTAHGGRPRLLLAEDSEPVRVVTAAMLKAMGCDVEAVVHGEEAVRLASRSAFDVIVLDIEMPVMDGITAAKSIRRMSGESRATPLMALSAFLADAMQQASWSETFDIALPKPANRNELHAAVRAALNWVPAADLAARIQAEPVIHGNRTGELRSSRPPNVWRELATIACRDIENSVRQIEHYAALGEMSPLAAHAFALNGIARTYHMPRLTLAASHLETASNRRDAETLMQVLKKAALETLAALRDTR